MTRFIGLLYWDVTHKSMLRLLPEVSPTVSDEWSVAPSFWAITAMLLWPFLKMKQPSPHRQKQRPLLLTTMTSKRGNASTRMPSVSGVGREKGITHLVEAKLASNKKVKTILLRWKPGSDWSGAHPNSECDLGTRVGTSIGRRDLWVLVG